MQTSSDEFPGGYLCRAIRYVVHGAPDQVVVCHCPDCRRATGAQSVAWIFLPLENFEVRKGSLAEYKSSPGVTRSFCERCRTTISWVSEKQPGRIDVTVGSLDEPTSHTPTKAVYRRHKLPWASEI